ncbi:MAG TPA: very short patch repair protein, partial [Planctomycetaceae bacterium]|nr:very short patch repair protein [Planctomycetaceae bacterium]
RRNLKALRADGWQVLVIWECWVREPEKKVVGRLEKFLLENL